MRARVAAGWIEPEPEVEEEFAAEEAPVDEARPSLAIRAHITPAEPTPVAATLAEASRERRDIVSGEVMDEARLIRFVAGPDGAVVPDLARKLPGRGLWVAADRASVETGGARRACSPARPRPSSRRRPTSPTRSSAADARGFLSGLGLARKAGDLTSGFEKVLARDRRRQGGLADRGGRRRRGRPPQAAGRRAQERHRRPVCSALFSSDELGLALGGENVIHTAFLAGRGAERWTADVERLSGFRPLFPESWREEP